MRIAIDAMGGDQAPGQILQGALDAVELLSAGDELILVGNPEVIQQHAGERLAGLSNVRIEAATQVITMDDSPAKAIRGKPDSSIVKMVRLARAGGADAIISAGNTGALVASGVLMLKTLAGAERPGIAVMLPSAKGAVMLCDAGANPEPTAAHLYQYAVMATEYTRAMRGVENPSVAILNIGSEEEKGTALVKAARDLMKADPKLNFIGYVEGRDISKHPCDVLITDGFTGNVVLKVVEGWSEALLHGLQKEIMAESPALLGQVKPAMGRFLKKYDHEEYGGALLLGVSGVFLKVHGSAGARAIKNAVAAAKTACSLDINRKIVDRLAVTPQ